MTRRRAHKPVETPKPYLSRFVEALDPKWAALFVSALLGSGGLIGSCLNQRDIEDRPRATAVTQQFDAVATASASRDSAFERRIAALERAVEDERRRGRLREARQGSTPAANSSAAEPPRPGVAVVAQKVWGFLTWPFRSLTG